MTDKQLINQLKIFSGSVKSKSVKANINRIIKTMEHADAPERAKARTLAKRTSLFIESSKKKGTKSLEYYQSGQYQKDVQKVKAKLRREEKKTGKSVLTKQDITTLSKQELQSFNKNFKKKVVYVDTETGEVLNKKQIDKEIVKVREQRNREQEYKEQEERKYKQQKEREYDLIIQNAIERVNSLPDKYNNYKKKFLAKIEKVLAEEGKESLANQLQAEAYSGGVPYADWVYRGSQEVVGSAEPDQTEELEYNQDEFLLDTFY